MWMIEIVQLNSRLLIDMKRFFNDEEERNGVNKLDNISKKTINLPATHVENPGGSV